ncbi:DEKNAAC100545 [Brettanomyces naardenensis]|uniref:Potassium transport protein n=1 Tax=Brettanomyces naardenensis TaxID=13370 RepID=A0A448YF43_BRENA|nr:DEKNAAC100545 [Brettanomyces naardenensis]
MTRYPTVVGGQIKKSVGYRIRKVIYRVDELVGPWMRKLIPNFIVAHYVYIFALVIIGSVMIYPNQEIRYIDALFFCSGAATQAGLNTINMNDLNLFQQLVIYFISLLSTPIFINTMVVFMRMYWFEKSMDDIKEKSAKDFKMRRTATLAAIRTQTMDYMRSNSKDESSYGTHNAQEDLDKRLHKVDEGQVKRKTEENEPGIDRLVEEEDSQSSKSSRSSRSSQVHGNIELQNMTKKSRNSASSADSEEGLDDEDGQTLRLQQVVTKQPRGTTKEKSRDIQFAELPHPNKKSKTSRDIDPRDLYMSISMMQHRSQQKNADAESGPALHIEGPAERETLRLPGHHHKHRRYHRQRRHQKLMLLKQQAQRNFLARDELKEINKEEGESAEPAKNSGVQFKEPSRIWKKRWSRGFSQGASAGESGRRLSGVPKDIPENAILDSDDGSNEPATKSEGSSPVKIKSNSLDSNVKGKRSFFGKGRRLSVSPTMERLARGKQSESLLPKLSRRFTRTFTGRAARSPSNISPAEMTDDELISLYSRIGPGFNRARYLSWNPTIGRNSTFVALTESQREELGGVEYRSLKLLSIILVVYYVGFNLLILFLYLAFILTKQYYRTAVIADGVSPTWWAFFTANTTFNNVGLTLTPDSMMMFSQNAYVMITGCFFIVIGNTGFPVFLRFIIWIMLKLSRPLTMYHESLAFLLDHPRRCFTLLFPSGPTWWLLAVLVVLNGIDWILFIVLDFNNTALQYLPKGYRVLAGLFQAFSTRTAGLSVVNLSTLHSAIQVSYMIMMYISVLPVAISIRRTNVYEEQSLGLTLEDIENKAADDDSKKPRESFIAAHLRRQLSFDLWFIFVGLFIICVCENHHLRDGDYNFQTFAILFEIVSAYGTVGLSLGYPNYDPSFSGKMTTLSKLVIIAMMIRGRHRGLPYSIDRAVLLNVGNMKQRDEVQAYRALRRSQTMAGRGSSVLPPVRTASTFSGSIQSLRENGIPWRKAVKKVGRFAKRAASGLLLGPGGTVQESQGLGASTIPNSLYEDSGVASYGVPEATGVDDEVVPSPSPSGSRISIGRGSSNGSSVSTGYVSGVSNGDAGNYSSYSDSDGANSVSGNSGAASESPLGSLVHEPTEHIQNGTYEHFNDDSRPHED